MESLSVLKLRLPPESHKKWIVIVGTVIVFSLTD
jgi:hypothetical protein